MDAHAASEGWTPQRAAYLIDGRRLDVDSPWFTQAVAEAHRAHHRPLCLCTAGGLPVYVARLGSCYHLKRMPETGHQHRPDCPHHEPTADEAGLSEVMGTAIREDPDTGLTTLRLDFAMSHTGARPHAPPKPNGSNSVRSPGPRLSLGALLRYLWHEARLTLWRPGFEGKRSWGTVRRLLLNAAEGKVIGCGPLLPRLYIPEPFTVDQRDAINARRIEHWAQFKPASGQPQQLMLMIAELKEIVPARYGHKLVIKHLPDQAFGIDEAMAGRIGRRLGFELALWGSSDEMHMTMITTFGVGSSDLPTANELWLMPVTRRWLPTLQRP